MTHGIGGSVKGLGYAKNVTYYRAIQRLVSSSNRPGGTGPTLKCNGEFNKVVSKIGLISIDEAIFAGYAANVKNSQNYLQENATSNDWWTISPAGLGSSGSAYIWFIRGTLSEPLGHPVVRKDAIRSYISLKQSVKATGEGTTQDPYKVFL